MSSRDHFLIFVRHSQPEIVLGVAAREWRLSPEGRCRCKSLAKEIALHYQPVAVASSAEPKAIETAEFIARPFGLPVEMACDLREHEREPVRVLDDAAFQAAIAAFFTHPEELVYGHETAAGALARFSRAVTHVMATHPVGDIVVVTHGTVMSSLTGDDPLALWRSLRLPDMRVIERPDVQASGAAIG